jgi:hydroxyacylglutathione hydrolase
VRGLCLWQLLHVGTLVLVTASTAVSQVTEPTGGGVETGSVPSQWPASGPKCMEVPDWQVHEFNPNLYIVRQSGCLDYEKPFLYLIFGENRALLLDTGSRDFPAAQMVENVVGKWLRHNRRAQIELIVAHSHPHSDHTAGDEQLKSLKSRAITINYVAPTVERTTAFFQMAAWPEGRGHVDLGNRVLDVIAIPGHSAVSVAFYDRQTGILFTGDSLYPGRLYVHDWDDFVKSTQRLVDFTQGKVVSYVLGCHVEETTTPYLDYPIGTIYQPHEHELALSRGALLELNDALAGLKGTPTRLALRDFSIWPVPADSQLHGAAKDRFGAREKEQLENMWNQPQQ